jgi:hypothetical protein
MLNGQMSYFSSLFQYNLSLSLAADHASVHLFIPSIAVARLIIIFTHFIYVVHHVHVTKGRVWRVFRVQLSLCGLISWER